MMSIAGVALVVGLSVLLLVTQQKLGRKLDIFGDKLVELNSALEEQKTRQSDLEKLQKEAKATQKELKDRQKHMSTQLNALVDRNRLIIQRKDTAKSMARPDVGVDQILTLGFQALEEKDWKKTVQLMDIVIDRDPQRVEAYEARGYALYKLKDFETSALAYEKAFELHDKKPKFGYLYIEAARSWSGLNDRDHLEKALQMLDRAIEEAPTQWLTYRYRGFVNYLLKDYAKAEGDWRMSAMQTTDLLNQVGSLENIGLIYLQKRDWEMALEHTDEIFFKNPKSPWNLLFRWIAADKLGKRALAKEAKQQWKEERGPDFATSSIRRYLPAGLRRYLQK